MTNVKELALKYYPDLWNLDRLKALVRANKLTADEFKEVTGNEYVVDQ